MGSLRKTSLVSRKTASAVTLFVLLSVSLVAYTTKLVIKTAATSATVIASSEVSSARTGLVTPTPTPTTSLSLSADPTQTPITALQPSEVPALTPAPTPVVTPGLSPVATPASQPISPVPTVIVAATPAPTPKPVTPTPAPALTFNAVPVIAPGYTVGSGAAPITDSATRTMLSRLGYSEQRLWQAGIKIVSYSGNVPKHCPSTSGRPSVSGLAIKPFSFYPSCPDGNPVIPDSYKTPGKCTVHFNSSNSGLGMTSYNNSTAVLAHEISHCLHFIYGENSGINQDYVRIRQSAANLSTTGLREVFADDFMICRHGANTAYGAGSYYSQFGQIYPSSSYCVDLNQLYAAYFPI